MRLQKLNCFRFWIVNYAFCEGPVHKFYTNLLSSLVEKFVKEEYHEAEAVKRENIERILLKGDYQDFYLITLKGDLDYG